MNLFLLPLLMIAACTSANSNDKPMDIKTTPSTIHEFKVEAIDGTMIDFSQFKGKKILVVNTASKCGFTRQYEGLEKLYKENQEKLVVVGFPANNFGSQEPGSNEEVAEFCKRNFGVTFPLAAKTDVVGEKVNPVFKWLTSKEENGVLDAKVEWNFTKFLIDENGKLIATFPSKIEPQSDEILQYLK